MGCVKLCKSDTKTSTKSDGSSSLYLPFSGTGVELSTQEQQGAECSGSDHGSFIPVVLSGQESCRPPFPKEVG